MSIARTTTKWLIIAALASGATVAAIKWGPAAYARIKPATANDARQQQVRTAVARRGDLRIVVAEDGKLRAIKNHPIFPQLRGQSRISFLAPEGAQVKKGDKLVEFDKKQLEEQLATRIADLEAAKRELVVKEEAVKIQISTSKANVAAAATKQGEADVALKVYRDLEGPKKLNEMETQLNETRNKLNAAIKTLAETQKKIDDQLFVEEDQRKVLEREVVSAREQVDAFKRGIENILVQQKIFRRYDYPQNISSKKQALDNAVLEVEKAKVAAGSEVHQKEAELNKVKDSIKRHEREIANLQEEIKNSTLYAPLDGMVLYGDPTNDRGYYNYGQQIRVGSEWYGSNTIMTIPDLSAFEVSLTIGEEYRGKLQEGATATLTLEAIPGLVIEGKLTKISNLARNRQPWDQSSPKVFDATVLPSMNDKRMVSGMSVRSEILAEVVKDVMLVPIEGVFNEDGKTICYIKQGEATERREVKVGKSNDDLVEIVAGLNEGEIVDLTPTKTSAPSPATPVPNQPQPTPQPVAGK